MAVCLLPGTELSFAEDVREWAMAPWSSRVISYRTAIFRQVNKEKAHTHHDALEFPDGKIVLLTTLKPGQQATVLQLPAGAQKAQPEPAAHSGVNDHELAADQHVIIALKSIQYRGKHFR